MKAAVLDLGTNTFQLGLYLVEPGPHLIMIEEDEVFVTLSKESSQELSSAAAKRARQAIKHFVHQIDAYNPAVVLAIGTAGFRQLQGAKALQEELTAILERPIQIISGEEEATYTCQGVSHAISAHADYLHMDVGGGSIEFSLVKADTVQYVTSLPIGAAVVAERFDVFDKLTPAKEEAIRSWLSTKWQGLWEKIGTTHPILVGTSGSFEAIPALAQPGKSFASICGEEQSITMSSAAIATLFSPLLKSSLSARLQWPGLHQARAPYFLAAAFIIQLVMQQVGAEKVVIARYGLREGYLLHHLANETSQKQLIG